MRERARMAIRVLVVVWLWSVGGWAPMGHGTARAQSDLEVHCRVGMVDSECTFTNVGGSAGSMCVRVILEHKETGERVRGETVCSGEVGPSTTVTQPVAFVEDTSACIPVGDCEMEIETISFHDAQSEEQDDWLRIGGLLLLLLVVGSTIWVGVDAHRLGMEGPWNWVLMSALLWVIGFPWYLMERSRALADQQGGKSRRRPSGGGGPPWVCKGCSTMNTGDTCDQCGRSK